MKLWKLVDLHRYMDKADTMIQRYTALDGSILEIQGLCSYRVHLYASMEVD